MSFSFSQKKHSSGARLMTEGNIAKQLILFALPLLVGNLFQQLYNTVDSIVVAIMSAKQHSQQLALLTALSTP